MQNLNLEREFRKGADREKHIKEAKFRKLDCSAIWEGGEKEKRRKRKGGEGGEEEQQKHQQLGGEEGEGGGGGGVSLFYSRRLRIHEMYKDSEEYTVKYPFNKKDTIRVLEMEWEYRL